jgi:CHRD domain
VVKNLWALIAVAVLGAALVAVGGAAGRSQANRVHLVGAMTAAQEVPPPTGDVAAARGKFTATLTRSGTGATIAWRLTFSGLTGPGTAAHIHIAPPGQAGPVAVPLCGPCESGVTGTANVDATVLKAIKDGRAYVNVHTARNKAGEIRAQLAVTAAAKTVLRARQEVPRPKGKVRRARGVFTVTAAKVGSQATLVWRLTFSKLTGRALAAHIHLGRRGVAGPVAVPLCGPCKSGARGKATVRGAVLAALESGRAYVNVHTRRNKAGEIRGQLPALPLTLSP